MSPGSALWWRAARPAPIPRGSPPRGLSASDFSLETKARGETFDVDVSYASGNATAFKVDPPVQDNYGRVAIERKHLNGVTDPIASFILKGRALSPDLCNRGSRSSPAWSATTSP